MAAPHTKAPAHKSAGKNKLGAKPSGVSKSKKPAKSSGPKPKPVQQKTKSTQPLKKKKRTYTDKELGIPQLNGIRPAGVVKPPNMKKGKNFVDDKESMNTILAMVMAEKEGNIESKMIRARQMEEIREAKRIEAEKRAESKKASFEERKQEIKDTKKSKRKSAGDAAIKDAVAADAKKSRKRVSFG